MYNWSLYNQTLYNWVQDFISWASTDDIIFNWLWLQNLNITTSFKNDDNLPGIEISKYQNPVVDWGWVLNRRYTSKKISLKWYIKADNETDLNNLIDIFKLKTSVVEWFLDIKVNWIYRRTRATVVSNQILDRKHYNITVVPFEITFETLDPFFYNKSDDNFTDAGITGNHSAQFRYYWTAVSQPRVYLIFDTGWWTDTIVFTLNGKQLTVNQAINDWDVLLYDSITKTVTINWIEVDYVWTFPQIQYWDNLFDFQINWAPLLDITILYAINYL